MAGKGGSGQRPQSPRSHVSQSNVPQQPELLASLGDEPPAYTVGPAVAPSPHPQLTIPGFPNVDYSKYLQVDSELSKCETTVTFTSSHLVSRPDVLANTIRQQATLPPKPTVRIKGSHDKYGDTKVDFDIRLNLMPFVYREGSDAWNYMKTISDSEIGFRGGTTVSDTPVVPDGNLTAWAQKFCSDASVVKSFTLERQVINWDTSTLEGLIRNLLASLQYKGTISITFPCLYSKVVVQPPAQGFKSLFGLLGMRAKRYEVVKAIWPYARDRPGEQEAREVAVKSERAWWEEWRAAIAKAVLQKRCGWVGLEDRLEAAMGPKIDLNKLQAWGASY